MKALRIAIACGGLCIGKGGSERAAVNIACEMKSRGHFPFLFSYEAPDGNTGCAYKIPEDIPFLAVRSFERHDYLSYMKNFLVAENFDVFLSLQSDFTHLYWMMLCKGSGIPFICSERAAPAWITRNGYWNQAGRLASLAGADCIHNLLDIYAESIPPIFAGKLRIIPNAAPINAISANPAGGQRKKLLYLARFKAPKKPQILISAFSQILNKHPEWDLELWGHGPQEKELRQQISANGLGSRVKIMGIAHKPAEVYASAQIYCLPSDFEGFPNSVLEAMAAGLPVVGFASCRGLAGVVNNGETGLLSEEATPQSLAITLGRLLGDAGLRVRMGESAKKESAKYAPDKIYDQWENLFFEMSELKNRTAMDAMRDEKFTNRANLSAAARAEWLYRDFEGAMPWSFAWLKERACNFALNIAGKHGSKGLS